MAKRSTKSQQVVPITLSLNGGMNLSQSPSEIGDNELISAVNMIYDNETDLLTTRPGTDLVASMSSTAYPIRKLHGFVKDSTNKWLVAACGATIYKLNTTNFSEIAALHDTTTTPALLTFNEKMLVADGGTTISAWTGTSYAGISGSPAADALAEIKNRVVCNATDEPDSVYLSGPEDETDWETASGAAVGIKAGFGDGLNVNGFAALGSDLVISKTVSGKRKLMRLNVAAESPVSWAVETLSNSNAAQNSDTILQAFNDVLFADDNGFKTLKGVQQYGDLTVDPTGRKINTLFSDADCSSMVFLPYFNAVWFILSTRVYCFHLNGAFTSLRFEWGTPTAICEFDGDVYIGSSDGKLYKIDKDGAQDNGSDYVSEAKTKLFSGGGSMLLKSVEARLKPKNSGSARIYIYTGEVGEVIAKEITLIGSGQYIYDATGKIDAATNYISDEGLDSWRVLSRTKARSSGVGFVFRTQSGRVAIENLKAQFAVVE